MKKCVWMLAMLVTALTAACAVENQAYWGIFAETSVFKMAGMPEMPDIPGMDMPGMPSGKPTRALNIRLWSPNLAPKEAFAYVVPPAGAKLGKRLDLDLYRPEPEKVVEETVGETEEPAEQTKFTMKIYWGSSETVKQGQPKVITWGEMTPEQQRAMEEQAKKAEQSAKSSYYYKPNWTTGYWPTKKQSGKIAKDASLVGKYDLVTNYTGNIAIEAPKEVDFLAPFDLASPSFKKLVPMDAAIKLAWKQIPNALGLNAMIFGMEGENTMILWFSSESYQENLMGIDWDYMQMADVKRLVDEKVMMPGAATNATVPAGIFKNCDMVMLTMIGYGPGAALAEGQPLPRIQTKTSLMAMLGGKEMEEQMGDEELEYDEEMMDDAEMGDMGNDEADEEEAPAKSKIPKIKIPGF